MTNPMRSYLRAVLVAASVLLLTACATPEAGSALLPANGPRPSPRPGFTGLALPATLPAPSKMATPTPKQNASAASGMTTLTILYTNDTRGYVDPCG